MLYSRLLLVIYSIYSTVYMSIPISQFIPLPLSPLVNIKLFFFVFFPYIGDSISVL